MALYVKVLDGFIVDIAMNKDNPNSNLDGDGFPIWRPTQAVPRPAYNPLTHHAPVEGQSLRIGSSVAINGPTVIQSWLSPIAKSQQEINNEAEEVQEKSLARIDQPNSIEKALMVALYRQIKGTTPAGVADSPLAFRTYLKGLM
jgi:hypothetical protein